MQDTIPRAPTEAQAARARNCPLCEAAPGVPCQAKPAGDHLARYLDAYTAGQLTRAYLAAVLGEMVVITRGTIITGDPGAAKAYAATHQVLCAHADDDGRGAHWLAPGQTCTATEADR